MNVSVEQKWSQFEMSLQKLDWPKQLAFGTFSCGRAANYYANHCRAAVCLDPTVLNQLLQLAWLTIDQLRIDEEQYASFASRLKAACDEMEQQGNISAVAAQEACFAGFVLLEMVNGKIDAGQTMRIIRFVRDIVDMIIQDHEGLSGNDLNLEEMILENPRMKRELELHETAFRILASRSLDKSVIAELQGLVQTPI